MKGHLAFKSESRPGDTFSCAREPGPVAIIVKPSLSFIIMSATIFPKLLAHVLTPAGLFIVKYTISLLH